MKNGFLNETFGLGGRVALITGAARGLGFAIAQALGRAGAKIVVNDLKRRDLRARGRAAR